MEFKINTLRTRQSQNFDKDTIEVIKNGERINVYQAIQDAREDTEIYPTLEKYGSLKRMELNTQAVYDDIRNIGNLRDILEQQQEASNMWNNLPLEVRREFGHSKTEFLQKGEAWLKAKLDAEKELETGGGLIPGGEIGGTVNNGQEAQVNG